MWFHNGKDGITCKRSKILEKVHEYFRLFRLFYIWTFHPILEIRSGFRQKVSNAEPSIAPKFRNRFACEDCQKNRLDEFFSLMYLVLLCNKNCNFEIRKCYVSLVHRSEIWFNSGRPCLWSLFIPNFIFSLKTERVQQVGRKKIILVEKFSANRLVAVSKYETQRFSIYFDFSTRDQLHPLRTFKKDIGKLEGFVEIPV